MTLRSPAAWRGATLAAMLGLLAVAACGVAADDPLDGTGAVAVDLGSAGDQARHDKVRAMAVDPSTQVVVIDMDGLGSPQAALSRAVQARDAAGDAGRLVYLVRARRPADARAGVEALEAQGFEWVAPVWSPNPPPRPTVRRAATAVEVKDWDVFVDPPTRFAFVKTPDRWVFVRQLDEEQMSRLPRTTLTSLLPPDDDDVRVAHPALEPSGHREAPMQ